MNILNEFITEIKRFGVLNAARLAGISAKTIYNWTEGITIPTLVKAQQVANAMGLEFLIFDKM